MGDSRYGMTNPVRAQLVLRREPVPRAWRGAQSGRGSVGAAGAELRSAGPARAAHGAGTGRSQQDSAAGASPRPVPAHRRR